MPDEDKNNRLIEAIEKELGDLQKEYQQKNQERDDIERNQIQPLRRQRDDLTRRIDEFEERAKRINLRCTELNRQIGLKTREISNLRR